MRRRDLRYIKRIRVLEKIYREGSSTRGDLAADMGLNPTSTIRLVAELKDLGLIDARPEEDLDRPGRPTEILTLRPTAGNAVGVEFGRGVLTAVVTDALGGIVHVENELPPPSFVSSEDTVRRVMAAMRKVAAAAEVDWRNVGAVGLALHDVVTSQGEWSVWGHAAPEPFAVRDFLAEGLSCVAAVDDVSRAFAKTEHHAGAERGAPDMMYVFIGKHNVGSGIFVNGAMLRSASGLCGEVGHIVVEEGGPLCQCGNRGCFEATSSGDAVVERYARLIESGVPTTLAPGDANFPAICDAFRRGEKAAQVVIHEFTTNLAKALASAISVSGATVILLGGNIRHAGDPLLADLLIMLRQRVVPALSPRIQVRYASGDRHAGALGAALLALDEAWSIGRFYAMAAGRSREQVVHQVADG